MFDLQLSDKTELNIWKKSPLSVAFCFLAQSTNCPNRTKMWVLSTLDYRPAVNKSNYTLLATHLAAKLTVLVCLAPGNSFHLYEMNDGGLSPTHLSSLCTSMPTVCGCGGCPQHSRVSYKRSQRLQGNTAAGWSLCGDPSQQTSAFREFRRDAKEIFPHKQLHNMRLFVMVAPSVIKK